MKLCYGGIGSKDGTKWTDVEVKTSLPLSKKGLAIGAGLIVTGVAVLVRSAFIKGSDSYGDAYDKALQRVGSLDPSYEVNSAENRKYSSFAR